MRENNINLLRLFFALIVVISHCFEIAGVPEPIVGKGFGIGSYGTLGVYGFFVISGFLITRSYKNCSSLTVFLWHRILRIFPGLIVAVTLTVLAMYCTQSKGFIEYLVLPSVKDFFIGNAFLWNIGHNAIEGVLSINRFNVIDGPLWTLPIEIRMYLCVAIVGCLSILEDKKLFNILIVFSMLFLTMDSLYVFILNGALEPSKMQAAYPCLYFVMGSFFFINRIRLVRVYFLICVVIAVVSVIVNIPLLVQVISLAYCIYYLSFKINLWRNLFNRIGDFSFGVYIYGFVVSQSVYFVCKTYFNYQITVLPLICFSLVILFPISMCSYFLIEKPALKLKNIFNNKL